MHKYNEYYSIRFVHYSCIQHLEICIRKYLLI